jgi:release factor glutamine methyltransferase
MSHLLEKPMSDVTSYLGSLERSRWSRVEADRPSCFTLGGRDWDLLDDVFAPPHHASTSVALELLGLTGEPERRPSGSLLEIGCGTGVIAVTAALLRYHDVVAADINPHAVDNTVLNAQRHGVAHRLRSVRSDLFAGLGAGERFDTIVWSSNYVLAPPDFEYRSVHERAYVDPGYAAHRRYLAEARSWTTEGGRALLHFSSRGDLAELDALAGQCGNALDRIASTTVLEGTDVIEHYLLHVVTG